MEIINIDNVNFTYPDGNKKALKNINLKVNEGEFILIAGPSGCGKSTLIRLLNRIIPDYYGGTLEGNVYINNKDIDDFKKDEIVTNVGMVYQHPEKQIVLQDVEREIAFGLENLNKDINFMKRNVSEVMSLLSLNGIKEKQTDEISGGQKQRVAIASVLAMNPDILLFDEPISQLDPINGEEVLNSIKRLNVDMGKTIILVEQRLDKCFHMADRIIFMENGEIIEEGTSTNIPKSINKKYHLPNIAYVFRQAQNSKLPITVKEGRDAIKDIEFKNIEKDEKNFSNKVLKVDKVNFEYERGSKTLKNINFDLGKGEIMAVMGENGAGKSTLFKIMAGIIEDYKGKIIVDEKNLKKVQYK
ncbi:ABC transporter ATP-binding protein [Clostridium senegalense]|uniref:ABC transporter ATP-binding protein n=1 Tax=Clostridium senegalense TaxID=1465809 RepID=UPI0002DF92C7|nr:ABC transporter ATP-binding protein [Clostridium senegalense]